MIFQHTWEAIIDNRKTQTRRIIKPGEMIYHECGEYRVYTAGYRLKWASQHVYTVQPGRGKPSIARIAITHISRTRLQDITDYGAVAEGFASRDDFASAWDAINRHPGQRWTDNPEVWVINFVKLRG